MAIKINGTVCRNLEEQVQKNKEDIEELKAGGGGGGGTPSAYIKSAEVSGNTLTLTNKDDTTVVYTPEIPTPTTYTAGDGLSLVNNEFSVKVGYGLFFDDNDNVCLNNATKQAIESIATKSTVSGTNDGTNWTSITINGETYNIPSGGGGSQIYLHELSFEGSGQAILMTLYTSTSTPFDTVNSIYNYLYGIMQGYRGICISAYYNTTSANYIATKLIIDNAGNLYIYYLNGTTLSILQITGFFSVVDRVYEI